MNLRDRFDSLTGQIIEEMVEKHQEENLHLDFKTVSHPPFETKDDRKTLAKTVSAFANSDGGLIVWGVDARKLDGVDCAQELKPLSDIQAFKSKLASYEGDATSPIVEGLRTREILLSSGAHVAVTLVPASDAGPHQAKMGEDRYYKRSGSQSLKMEHFDIEDMFGRRKKPVLELTSRASRSGSSGEGKTSYRNARIHLEIRNDGRGAARDIYLALESPEGTQIIAPGGQNVGFREIRPAFQERERHFTSASDFVLHPGLTWSVALFDVKILDSEPIPKISPRFRLAAEGFRLVEGNVSVDLEEVGRVIGRTP